MKSVKSTGIRVGNWLSQRQAQALPSAPDITTACGLRDRAIVAVLIGCGLRRSDVLLSRSHMSSSAMDGGASSI
jgi:site-specific recombinase XerD